MNTKRPLWQKAVAAAIVLVVAAGAYLAVRNASADRRAVRYITRPVRTTDITAVVNETGTINPVDQIQVGTQVSGTIATLNVDFNSRVHKGEVLAILDQAQFQAAVAQSTATAEAAQSSAASAASGVQQAAAGVDTATANLRQAQSNLNSARAAADKSKAQLALAQVTVSRDASLLKQGFIPQSQMDQDQTAATAAQEDVRVTQAAIATAQAQVAAATSQLQSARQQVTTAQAQAKAAQHQAAAQMAQLEQARYNLSRTVITSPIDGIVMARNVSIGQTVAASLQTPTLFTIASNLTNMQVDTSVDEADVGNVRQGARAQISVTAYPNVTFNGMVQQVRINPTVVQNVVTYDAVVLVQDTSGRLKPGMTAQVAIDAGTRSRVLAVPTAALLYRPQAERAQGAAGGPGGPGGFGAPVAGTQVSAPVAGAPGSKVTVWVLRNGRPSPVQIVIGLSDSRNVEVASGELHEGDPVIVAQRRGGARGGPGGGGSGGPGGAGGGGQGGPGGSGGQGGPGGGGTPAGAPGGGAPGRGAPSGGQNP